jgi:hypothetical protein
MSEFAAEPKKRDEKKMCGVCGDEFLANNTRQHYKKRSHLSAAMCAGLYCPRTCAVRHPGAKLTAPPDTRLFPDEQLQRNLIYCFGARIDEPKAGGVCMVCGGMLTSVPNDTGFAESQSAATSDTVVATPASDAGVEGLPPDDARLFPTFVLNSEK